MLRIALLSCAALLAAAQTPAWWSTLTSALTLLNNNPNAAPIRAALLSVLDTNGNGHLDQGDLDPIILRVSAAPGGAAILAAQACFEDHAGRE